MENFIRDAGGLIVFRDSGWVKFS